MMVALSRCYKVAANAYHKAVANSLYSHHMVPVWRCRLRDNGCSVLPSDHSSGSCV